MINLRVLMQYNKLTTALHGLSLSDKVESVKTFFTPTKTIAGLCLTAFIAATPIVYTILNKPNPEKEATKAAWEALKIAEQANKK